ncbi:hypothetical protein CXB51_009916 [Gossypium anomalum]|uniref:Glycosyltransferase subfamily 4-like N-terminal domain-containing protein n=1 Tax=Gossypium anomalum TaxID=47600 RepID=A0A8J5ZBS7_9ROSI|nr:hypothetical protein CXB51_009916 [Gossypium anomalum]
MGSKHQSSRSSSSSSSPSICFSNRFSTILTVTILFTSLYLFISPIKHGSEPLARTIMETGFNGDLRDANFPWNSLCFGNNFEKLKLAVFSKTWPIGAAPGGMERHAATLYHALAAKGHEIHVFTVPSDRMPHIDIHQGNLHVYFAANDHGSVNCSLAFEIFNTINANGQFDYVHTESVSLPHWRAKMVPHVAVTWHGIWYEIMHSKLFEELVFNSQETIPKPVSELHEAMPRLVDEIRFFPSYTQHICISKSAGEVLVNIYQLPQRNVHVILNGVDETKFVHDPESGTRFRKKHGSGPWGKRYAELGSNVKVLGALEPSELSEFYNAIDVFVNPTLRPQGLDLTLMEAMHCGKPVLTPNYPSIVGSVVVNQSYGYTFSPNVESFVEALKSVIKDGAKVLKNKGIACRQHALSMFTATKMADAYERFFLCMKNDRFCHYPLPTDC